MNKITNGDAVEIRPSGNALQPAPREVPRALVRRLVFGGHITAFGWAFAALGMALVLVFVPAVDMGAPTYDRRATATLTRVEETNSSENDRPIYRVHYTFLDTAGIGHRGESYTMSPPSDAGTWIVDYRADAPSESQLSGMRHRPFSAIGLVALAFPLVGLAIVFWQLRTSLRHLRLLRSGIETHGKLVHKRSTAVHMNDQPVIALTFEYDVAGTRYTTTVKTLTPALLEDDEREPMLYDPHAPANATTLDHLPGSPRIAPSGNLAARPGRAMHLLIAPVAFAVLLVATVIRML